MNAKQKIEKIVELLEDGRTVYFKTALQHTKVTKRTLESFRKAGYELFKADGPHILMRRGKHWDSMIGCQITYT